MTIVPHGRENRARDAMARIRAKMPLRVPTHWSSPVSSHDARLELLETKVAFQEDTIQQLNDALVGQQARIDQLEALLRVLAEQLRAGQEPEAEIVEPPPPHY
jgi:SlyX protein